MQQIIPNLLGTKRFRRLVEVPCKLLGKGDGTFAPTITIATQSQFSTFVFGDVNGDGITDMVASDEDFLEKRPTSADWHTPFAGICGGVHYADSQTQVLPQAAHRTFAADTIVLDRTTGSAPATSLV